MDGVECALAGPDDDDIKTSAARFREEESPESLRSVLLIEAYEVS